MLDRKMYRSLIVALGIAAMGAAAQAQFTGIYTFNSNYDGANAYYADYLAQGADGNLHGTMPVGAWATPLGSWFDYVPGAVSPLIHELQSSAAQPQDSYSGLSLGIDGNLYGGSIHGGLSNSGGSTFGAIFKITNGVPSLVYQFPGGAYGSYPYSPPIQAPDGNLYGVTYDPGYTGHVYQILMSNGVGSRGWVLPLPSLSRAGLILANDGNLYGTVEYGGFTTGQGSSSGNGAVFQVTLGGALTGIYNFNPSSSNNNSHGDGGHPMGAVMQAADGYLYGTTSTAGAYAGGTLYKVALNGSGFTVIHNFQYNDGTAPSGGLVQGSDGYLYGLASANGYIRQIYNLSGAPMFAVGGTLFKVDTAGVNFVRMFTFYGNNFNSNQGSGTGAFATPALHTNGLIYGLTEYGGTGPSGNSFGTYANGGELFSYKAGLSPFINVVSQRAARVGDRVSLIGQGFSNVSYVTFGGVAAQKWTLNVVTDNFMTVVVPPGARSGLVTMVENNGVSYSTLYNFKIQCGLLLCP